MSGDEILKESVLYITRDTMNEVNKVFNGNKKYRKKYILINDLVLNALRILKNNPSNDEFYKEDIRMFNILNKDKFKTRFYPSKNITSLLEEVSGMKYSEINKGLYIERLLKVGLNELSKKQGELV